jgi:hypothetical protein
MEVKKYFYFTFGYGNPNEGMAQMVEAENEDKARAAMIKAHGLRWAFCYSADKWNEMINDENRVYPIEKLMPKILRG